MVEESRLFAEVAMREFGDLEQFEIDLGHLGKSDLLVAALEKLGCKVENRGRYYMIYPPAREPAAAKS